MSEEAAWEEGHIHSVESLERIKERKKPREKEDLRFKREMSPDVRLQKEGKPRAIEWHEQLQLLRERKELGDNRDLKLSEGS